MGYLCSLSLLGEGMRFTGQRRDSGRYFSESGTGVGAGHRRSTVPGERLRHCEAGMTFDGSDRRVTQDVGGYRRALGPREAGPGPIEDGVVAPARDGPTTSTSQDRVFGRRRPPG